MLVGVSAKNIATLQRAQNALARDLTRHYDRRGVTQSLANLHWLTVKWRIDYKIATITHKLLTSKQPSYLVPTIELYTPKRDLRSTGSGTLVVPRTKTVIGARGFRSAAPVIWNNLPKDIRKSATLCIFQSKLKTHYFRQAFK